MDSQSIKTPPSWTPYLVGAPFVFLFAGLCLWQISRGLEKQEAQRLFNAASGYSAWSPGSETQPWERLKVVGQFDSTRQFLLENIPQSGRQGYYVITPLRLREGEPLLLVNRGWIARESATDSLLAVSEARRTVRGRAGSLPRAGYKMGAAIQQSDGWPRPALFPDNDEISAALEQEVQPIVLLMDPEDEQGFSSIWQPAEFGPSRHFAYALQWLLMAVVLAGLLYRNYRRGGFER